MEPMFRTNPDESGTHHHAAARGSMQQHAPTTRPVNARQLPLAGFASPAPRRSPVRPPPRDLTDREKAECWKRSGALYMMGGKAFSPRRAIYATLLVQMLANKGRESS